MLVFDPMGTCGCCLRDGYKEETDRFKGQSVVTPTIFSTLSGGYKNPGVLLSKKISKEMDKHFSTLELYILNKSQRPTCQSDYVDKS